MIAFMIGTTAELIKIAPVFRELAGRSIEAELWSTNQQSNELGRCAADLELPEIHLHLPDGSDRSSLETVADATRWLSALTAQTIRRRSELRQRLWSDGRPPILVVHGDTLTAAAGALIAQFLRVDVAHIEAGLRSGNLFDPFPEELNRRLIGRLADVHFAPASYHLANLAGRGAKVDTITNTVVDALSLARSLSGARQEASSVDLRSDAMAVDLRGAHAPSGPFGIVSLHRFELLRDGERFVETLRLLSDIAARHHRTCLVVEDAQVAARIAALGIRDVFHEWFVSIGKLEYTRFVNLVDSAAWVITDSGGLQEEAAVLGLPCLLVRSRTERSDGLQHTARLVGTDLAQFERFILDPGPRVGPGSERGRSPRHPDRRSGEPRDVDPLDPPASVIIADQLVDAGYGAALEAEPSGAEAASTPDVSVVVVSRGFDGLTRSALRTLARTAGSSGVRCEVILVFAGSIDGFERPPLGSSRVDRLIRVREGSSEATMLNLGVRAATAARIVITAAEPLLDEAIVRRALSRAEQLDRGQVAVGVRTQSAASGTWVRRAQRTIFAKAAAALLGLRGSDPHPLVMALHRDQFLEFAPYIQANSYGFYPDLLSRLSDSGAALAEFPLELPYRQRGVSNPRSSIAAATALVGVGAARLLGRRARATAPDGPATQVDLRRPAARIEPRRRGEDRR